jgi:hypothetical protein
MTATRGEAFGMIRMINERRALTRRQAGCIHELTQPEERPVTRAGHTRLAWVQRCTKCGKRFSNFSED